MSFIKNKNIKLLILAIIIITPTVFNSRTVKAYNASTYVDGGEFTNVGSGYEVDWGAIAWGSDQASGGGGCDLSASYPPASTGDIRYDHFCGTHPIGDNGWQIMSNNRWWANNVYKSRLIPAYGDYNNGGGYDNNVFLYGPMYYADYPSLSGGSPWWISGTGNDYRRWGIQQYYREKPTPAMTNISINNFPHTYLESSTSSEVWASPTNSGTLYCEGDDRYPFSYGTEVQKDGAVRRGVIGITGSNGLKYLGYTDMNNGLTWYSYATDSSEWRQKSVDGDDKIVEMRNLEYSTSDGTNGLQTALYFKAEDGVDYAFNSSIQNKWLRSSSSYNYFYFSGTTVQRTKLKIDGQAPIWDDVNVTTNSSSSNTTLTVSGLKDVRGEAKTDVGCGVNSKGINLVVVPVNKAGVSLDLPQFITTYSIKSGSIESSSTISFDVNYSSLGFSKYNKFKIKATFSDNLDNTNYTNEYIVNRQIPKPQNAELSVEQYKYKKDNAYWVNCKDNFIIKTQCSSHTDFTGYPTETILYMGSGSAYAEQYNGFSSIATTQGSNINTSSDKDKYIKKYLEYIATEDNITKTLKSYHNLKANINASGLKYNLHTMGRTYYDSEWYLSSMYNSNDIIGIDGIAPTIDKAEGIDEYNKFTVKVTNIYDHDLSGSKEVDFIVKRNGDNIIKKTVLVSDKSTIRQVFTKDELKEYGEYTVEVWTRDNVDNEIKVSEIKVNMLNPINIAAKRVDIYDPREERYVSQVVSGLDYIAVVEYTNTGADDIDNTRPYSVGLNIADVESGTVKGEPLQVGETKEARFNFTAGEENLLGNVYEGTIDIDYELEESNENDNVSITKQPYKEEVSDTNPPTIPTPNTQGKPSVEVPIITIKLDFIADYINVVELGTENDEVDELICEDPYRLKYKVSNNSSLNIKYIDIKNKSFETTVYYDDNIQLDTIVIDDIGATENKTLYKDFTTPLLPDGVVEENKALKEVVDSSNKIYEMDEKNNSLLRRKKVLALKVTDYRITEMVNPIQKYTFPIMYTDMPASCKSGYNVTFRCNVKGNRDKLKVYAKLRDTNGTPYDTITMTKVEEVSTTEGIYEYVLTVPLDLPQGTIISSEVIATQDTATYNFNNKNLWNGKTLTIGGNAKEDIVIYRKY